MKARKIMSVVVVLVLVFALLGALPVSAAAAPETIQEEGASHVMTTTFAKQPRWLYLQYVDIDLSFQGRVATFNAYCTGSPDATYYVALYLYNTDWDEIAGPYEDGPTLFPFAEGTCTVPRAGAYFASVYVYVVVNDDIVDGTILDSEVWYVT